MATTIEGAIAARLAANAGIIAIIGTNPIVPITDPTPLPRPRLYYQTINERAMDYSNDGPTNLRQSVVFYYVAATDLLTAKQLAKLVRVSLDGLVGTVHEKIIGSIRVVGPIDEAAEIPPGATKPAQRVRLELTIDWYDD